MNHDTAGVARSRKYVVAHRFTGWRILGEREDFGVFPERDEAVRHACRLARDQALAGTVGIVVVRSAVQEMHCFTPPPGMRPPHGAGLKAMEGGGR